MKLRKKEKQGKMKKKYKSIKYKNMPIVQFTHKIYGIMTTTPEYWIEYNLFDATDKSGDTWSVDKEDCSNPKVVSV